MPGNTTCVAAITTSNKHKTKKPLNPINNLKIIYTNIRGLKSKISCLIEQLASEKPHLYLLTETLLTTDTDMQIQGYTFFGKARNGRGGGGVAILVRNDIINLVIPHISDRDLEIMWVSFKRKKCMPILIGCYYGKQESRCSKDEINIEMGKLSEEIEEYRKEGEVMIFMDGNAKIGLLGEQKSRNGKLLEEVMKSHNLNFLNKNSKCKGKITRQNTKNQSEKSAIDFVVSTPETEKNLISMVIDEEGLYKIKGKNETDHNTIITHFQLPNYHKPTATKNSIWRINAPEENWNLFNENLTTLSTKMNDIFSKNLPINETYNKWLKRVEDLARKDIGRTTIRTTVKSERFSDTVVNLRSTKREMKKTLKSACDGRAEKVKEFKEIQEQIRIQITNERALKIQKRLNRISQDQSRNAFWRERKKLMQEPVKSHLTVKNESGKRQYCPASIKETMATYYENLYRKKPTRWHPKHDEIKTKISQSQLDTNYDNEWFNSVPTEKQVLEIIDNKKNGKATTDLKNEMMKRSRDGFAKALMPLIRFIWKTEQIPDSWNSGLITSIWKGKGDKENLNNHRGITVSSAIGNIVEEIIDRRIAAIVEFSQGQAGGKKGACTADHLFILRSLITIAKTKKQSLFITFYDVSKAYDNADVDNMLYVMWENGVRGKLWRILRNMSTNLTAKIKTRHGLSREIVRENGGRQGSRLTGRLFAKQMDVLSENFIENDELNVPIADDFSIGCAEYVDDVMTCTLGKANQNKVLTRVDEFAKINKLEWGEEKCQVMQVGRKVKVPDTWALGTKNITNTTSYKYLGDIITNDGKNKSNIENRFNRTQGIIRQINTTAGSEVMRKIETKTILELYERCVIPSFLNNAESWTLSTQEEKELDKLGIQILKRLFNLPERTPSPAIIYSFGTLYITQEIDLKKFMYFHKILKRENDHWTKKMLCHLKSLDIGWAKIIQDKLRDYNLEQDWDKIKNLSKTNWKNLVQTAVLNKNKQKLLESCEEQTQNGIKIKTKTAYIHNKLQNDAYSLTPLTELISSNKIETKTIILSRNGMLTCGSNFKATIPEICKECQLVDNESHRLNQCPKWQDTNFSNGDTKAEFMDVFSDDRQKLSTIIRHIQRVWELYAGNGTMKKATAVSRNI